MTVITLQDTFTGPLGVLQAITGSSNPSGAPSWWEGLANGGGNGLLHHGGMDGERSRKRNIRVTKLKAFLPISAAILGAFVLLGTGCKARSTVVLTNGYRLERAGGADIRLVAPNGKTLSGESISQFCLSGGLIYGWFDGREAYFLLDTQSGEFREFANVRELNRVLSLSGTPRLEMKNSYTFWDLQTGRKVPGK